MANVWKDGKQVAGSQVDSITPDKTYSEQLKEIVASLPSEAKPKVQQLLNLAGKIESLEAGAGKLARKVDDLKQKLEESQDGEAVAVSGIQRQLETMQAERRVVIRTALLMFAAQHGVDVEAQDVDSLVRLL